MGINNIDFDSTLQNTLSEAHKLTLEKLQLRTEWQ